MSSGMIRRQDKSSCVQLLLSFARSQSETLLPGCSVACSLFALVTPFWLMAITTAPSVEFTFYKPMAPGGCLARGACSGQKSGGLVVDTSCTPLRYANGQSNGHFATLMLRSCHDPGRASVFKPFDVSVDPRGLCAMCSPACYSMQAEVVAPGPPSSADTQLGCFDADSCLTLQKSGTQSANCQPVASKFTAWSDACGSASCTTRSVTMGFGLFYSAATGLEAGGALPNLCSPSANLAYDIVSKAAEKETAKAPPCGSSHSFCQNFALLCVDAGLSPADMSQCEAFNKVFVHGVCGFWFHMATASCVLQVMLASLTFYTKAPSKPRRFVFTGLMSSVFGLATVSFVSHVYALYSQASRWYSGAINRAFASYNSTTQGDRTKPPVLHLVRSWQYNFGLGYPSFSFVACLLAICSTGLSAWYVSTRYMQESGYNKRYCCGLSKFVRHGIWSKAKEDQLEDTDGTQNTSTVASSGSSVAIDGEKHMMGPSDARADAGHGATVRSVSPWETKACKGDNLLTPLLGSSQVQSLVQDNDGCPNHPAVKPTATSCRDLTHKRVLSSRGALFTAIRSERFTITFENSGPIGLKFRGPARVKPIVNGAESTFTMEASGAYVRSVIRGTQADSEDIGVGDMLVQINEQEVKGFAKCDVDDILTRCGRKRPLTLVFERRLHDDNKAAKAADMETWTTSRPELQMQSHEHLKADAEPDIEPDSGSELEPEIEPEHKPEQGAEPQRYIQPNSENEAQLKANDVAGNVAGVEGDGDVVGEAMVIEAKTEPVSQYESEIKSARECVRTITFVAGPLGLGFDYNAATKKFHVTAVRGQAQTNNVKVGDIIVRVGDLSTEAQSPNAPRSLGGLVRVMSSAPRPFHIQFRRHEDGHKIGGLA